MAEWQILYEDNHLLAVDKPAGMLTQPSGTDELALEGELKLFIKEREQKRGNVFLEAVHRLDRPVSGIVLFAKTSKALSRLNEAQRQRRIRKWYRAEVEGMVLKSEITLVHYLRKGDHRTEVVAPSSLGAKRAELQIDKVVGNTVFVEIKTGRYHQIRAQLAAAGAPVQGDEKYGAKPSKKPGIALCHCEMELPHPIGGEILTLHLL